MGSTESVSHDDLVVCARGGQDYKARDAIEAALFRGDLAPKWNEFMRGVAAEKYADEIEHDLDEDAIDAAAQAFRYQHDLITAEETEQWLAARGLNLDDFSDYFARRYCAHALHDKVNSKPVDYLSAPVELRDQFVVELILAGDLEAWTIQLSWRLAAAAAVEKEGVAPEAIEVERKKFLKRSGLSAKDLPGWLEQIGHDSTWFDQMLAMEAAFGARRDSVLLPQFFQRELATLRLPLTRFETEVIEVESRDSAQEALFCVREDGMSMEEVATEGRYPFRRDNFLLEDLEEERQQGFLSVAIGDVLEPIPHGDGFELCRVSKKAEPDAEDPDVRARIEHRLVGRHFSELSSKYIEWRLGGSAAPK